MAVSIPAREPALARINITPLVDVMLVLLVIFMVSAPLISQPIGATLPQPAPPIDTPKPLQLQLEITDDGAYRLNARPLSRSALRERLQDAALSDPRALLSVRATGDADYQSLVTALADARASGIANLGLVP